MGIPKLVVELTLSYIVNPIVAKMETLYTEPRNLTILQLMLSAGFYFH